MSVNISGKITITGKVKISKPEPVLPLEWGPLQRFLNTGFSGTPEGSESDLISTGTKLLAHFMKWSSIYATTDGENWTSAGVPYSSAESMGFANGTILVSSYVSASVKAIVRSIDNGDSWVAHTYAGQILFKDMAGDGSGNWIGLGNSSLYSSNDDGISFFEQPAIDTMHLVVQASNISAYYNGYFYFCHGGTNSLSRVPVSEVISGTVTTIEQVVTASVDITCVAVYGDLLYYINPDNNQLYSYDGTNSTSIGKPFAVDDLNFVLVSSEQVLLMANNSGYVSYYNGGSITELPRGLESGKVDAQWRWFNYLGNKWLACAWDGSSAISPPLPLTNWGPLPSFMGTGHSGAIDAQRSFVTQVHTGEVYANFVLSGTTYKSLDGVNWENANIGQDRVYGLGSAGSTIVVTGYSISFGDSYVGVKQGNGPWVHRVAELNGEAVVGDGQGNWVITEGGAVLVSNDDFTTELKVDSIIPAGMSQAGYNTTYYNGDFYFVTNSAIYSIPQAQVANLSVTTAAVFATTQTNGIFNCIAVYNGKLYWLDASNNISTVLYEYDGATTNSYGGIFPSNTYSFAMAASSNGLLLLNSIGYATLFKDGVLTQLERGLNSGNTSTQWRYATQANFGEVFIICGNDGSSAISPPL